MYADSSNVSFNGNTEVSSNHAVRRAGKPIRASADAALVVVRRIKKALQQPNFHR